MSNILIKSSGMERFLMLVELLDKVVDKTCHSANESLQAGNQAIDDPKSFLKLADSLRQFDKLPDLDDSSESDAWQRPIVNLRKLLKKHIELFDEDAPAGFALVPIVATQAMIDRGVAAAIGLRNAEPWGPHFWKAAVEESRRAQIEFLAVSSGYTGAEIDEMTPGDNT